MSRLTMVPLNPLIKYELDICVSLLKTDHFHLKFLYKSDLRISTATKWGKYYN